MTSMGFTQLKTDYCCFIQQNNNSFAIMIVWVDDILSFSNTDTENDRIEKELKSKFEVNTIGSPSMILGIKLTLQKPNQITLSQGHFINTLLSKFGLEKVNPVTTPLDLNVNLDNDETEENSKRSKRSSLPLLRYTNRFPDVPSTWDPTGHSLCCKQAGSIYATTKTKALDSCQTSISLPKGNSTFYTYLWRSRRITK